MWEKIEPKLGNACPWIKGLFDIDNTTFYSKNKFTEEDAIIESAKTLLELPKVSGVVIISNTNKVKSQDKFIVVLDSQEFRRRIEYAKKIMMDTNFNVDRSLNELLLYELVIFRPNILEALQQKVDN